MLQAAIKVHAPGRDCVTCMYVTNSIFNVYTFVTDATLVGTAHSAMSANCLMDVVRLMIIIEPSKPLYVEIYVCG